MNQQQSLAGYFAGWAGGRPARLAVAAVVGALAEASLAIADVLGQGSLAGQFGRSTGKGGEVDEPTDHKKHGKIDAKRLRHDFEPRH